MGGHRLRISENRVLKKACGSKRVEVTRSWGKLRFVLFRKFYQNHKTMDERERRSIW
jgi:hypothetical protein